MQVPVQIIFHGLETSPALQDLIHELAEKACRGVTRVTRCHVTVELPHKHHSQGRRFQVRAYLHVAGGEDVVAEHSSEDAQLAAREAFTAVRRQLDEVLERARGEVKSRT